jgi:heavy metal translocating P-type ATPase
MTCTLCALPSGADPFCCAGCQNVYAILIESGVAENFRDTALFQQSLELGLISNRPQPAAPVHGETREAVYQLSGLWCASCGWLIEHSLTRLPGVASAEVHFASDLLKIQYAPQSLPPDRIVDRVRSLGYGATAYEGRRAGSSREQNDLLLRLGVAFFLWMNVMMLSVILYAGYFESIGPSFALYLPLLLVALTAPAVFYCAAPVLRLAAIGARHGVLRMESLLALGILAAFGYSAVNAVRGAGPVYCDTACAIVTLVLAGKAIERAAKETSARAVHVLYGLMPNKARLMQDGRERFVGIQVLRPGAVFRVRPGERIPADGVVVDGRSHADESVLTGESVPQPKGPGDPVVCGSLNTGDALDIRATRVGGESSLARIARTVEEAVASRTEIERAVDRVSRWFIPAVLAIAVAAFAYAGLIRAIAVLVIACPCALGIATPLALTAAVEAAGRRGILVRDARVLETIRQVDVVVLDKTGTVTTGEFTLLHTAGDTSRMAALGAIESYSNHPIARALAGPGEAANVRHHPGGITGTVDGVDYFIGNRLFSERIAGGAHELPVSFGWDGVVRGGLAFGDRVRDDARPLCDSLRARGIRTVLLSGDCPAVTESVAKAIGADQWIAEATPDGKVELIRNLQNGGAKVAMLGDGVNDAPSLAQADLGIALGGGADIATEAAPLVLMGQSLSGVTETLDLAGRVFRIVRQNLFWAFVYNTAGIALAFTGVLNPIMAAAAMVLSSVSVIANSRKGDRRLTSLPRTPARSDPQCAPALPFQLRDEMAVAPRSANTGSATSSSA